MYDVMGSEDSPNPDTELMPESLREEIRRAFRYTHTKRSRCCFFLLWIRIKGTP